jgi:outer membrane receptor protein involved in Fe transport
MKANPKISAAVAAILSAPAASLVFAAAGNAETAAASSSNELTEVIVTAQRRSENVQNVPITIQALTAETLQQLSVTTLDDYIKYLPNVTQASWGPGQSLIFMRGLSAGALGTQGSGTDANFPNVAVYLDDQSAQMPYRNLDVYAADIERIEVLEGPQGTLFGAGAEAGAIRYITNKPKLDVTEGTVNGGYGDTAHGDNNSQIDATINLPIIPGTFAVRAVVFNDSRGGYINNVPGTFTRDYSDLGIGGVGGVFPSAKGCIVPNTTTIYASCQNVINNNPTVANAINPVTYQGMRASALWKFNDEWNALIAQTYQNMNAQGVFYQEPVSTDGVPLPPLSVTTFNPAYDKDSFENTAWTLNGQFGDIRAVYTGGYLVRNVEAQQDYTAYTRGNYADYYQCTSNKDGVSGHPICYSPSAYWRNTQRNTHFSNELRFSTPDEWRLRGLVGGYWEQFKVYDNTDWFYKSLPPCTSSGPAGVAPGNTGCMTDIEPAPGSTANVPGTRPDNESFLDDTQRGYRQYAFFTSWDFDLIPHTLILTAGTRYYNFSNTETGSNVYSFGCYDGGAPPCAAEDANNINKLNLSSTYSGFRSRANLAWHVTQDAMLYYTFSQGFRPGGFNRSSLGPYLNGNYLTPQAFAPDSLTNNEVGWKTEWLNHHLLVNGAVYQEDWKNVQQQFFDPSSTGNLSFVTNGANYRVRGLELQAVANVTTGLTIQGAASWNSSSQTNSPYLIGNVAGTALFGQPLTSAANPFGTEGSSLPQSPAFQANARVRYEWALNSYQPFVQAGFVTTAHSRSLPGNVATIAPVGDVTTAAFNQPGYTTYDAAIGVSKDNWTVQLTGQNLTNVDGEVFISASEAIETQTVIRPRVIMLRATWNFEDKSNK